MKSNQLIDPSFDLTSGIITIAVKNAESLTCDTNKLHADIMKRAAMVGLAQVRIVDAAAVPKSDGKGGVRTEAEMLTLKRERMAAIIEHLESGTSEWSRKAVVVDHGAALAVERAATLATALERLDPEKSADDVATFVAELSPAEVAQFLLDAEIAPIVAAIEREKVGVASSDKLATFRAK